MLSVSNLGYQKVLQETSESERTDFSFVDG